MLYILIDLQVKNGMYSLVPIQYSHYTVFEIEKSNMHNLIKKSTAGTLLAQTGRNC